MTETQDQKESPPEALAAAPVTPPPAKAPRRSRKWPHFLLLFFVVLVVSFFALRREIRNDFSNPVTHVGVQTVVPPVAAPKAPLAQDIQVGEAGGPMDEGVSEDEEAMNDKVAPILPPSGKAHDWKVMEAALESMQMRLSAVEDKVDHQQVPTRLAVAGLAALVPLEFAALQGHPFTAAYEAMQATASSDAKLQGLLAPLEPLAATGVPTRDLLLTVFQREARVAQLAQERADAVTWMDRVRVALDSLVQIKRADGTGSGRTLFDPLQAALEQGRWDDLSGGIEALPPAAKQAMLPFEAQIKRRAVLEGALRDIGTYLAAEARGD